MPKVTDSSQAEKGPQSWPLVHPGPPATSARHQAVPSAAHSREQPSCTELAAGWAAPSVAWLTLPCRPGASLLRAHDTLGVGLGDKGERRMLEVKK